MRLANDLFPTIIVVIVVVLLASIIIYNSNRNQQEVIKAVRQAQSQRQSQLSEALEAIKQRMDEKEWQDVQKDLRENKSVR